MLRTMLDARPLVAMIVAGGVGVVGLGLGTAFGVVAISDKSSAQNACSSTCANQAGADKWSSAVQAGNISTAGFIIFGVGAVGAATLWFTAPSSPRVSTQVGLGPGTFTMWPTEISGMIKRRKATTQAAGCANSDRAKPLKGAAAVAGSG